jgi:Ca2+-binding RTX toxin-like protein
MANFTLTAGTDTFTGTAGQQNTFSFAPGDLQGVDTITGGSTGGFIDVLSVTAGGAITSGQFALVTNVEELDLSASGNSVTLTNGFVAGTSLGYFNVVATGSGNDTVDASGITNGTTIVFTAASGADTLKGGNGNDVFLFAPANLTSGDTIIGGSGFDYIQFTQAGTVAGSAFTNVSGVDALLLGGAGNNVTLTDQLVNSADSNQFTVRALGSGTNTVDGSALTSTHTVIFYAGTGTDTLKGGAGSDSFVFTGAADLTSADTVTGGSGIDSLLFVNGGTVASTGFANVSGVELLALSTAGNNVTLTNNLVASSSIGAFVVATQGGSNVVDASGVTNGVSLISLDGANSADTIKGGSGSDAFLFAVGDLTSADVLQGGGGTDAIYLTGSGTVAASAFTNVSGVEELVFLGGDTNVTLNNTSAASSSAGAFFVVDNGANNTVDASGFTTATLSVIAGSGNDTFKGGNGNDVFSFQAADLTSADTVIGGAGADTLVISTNGTVSAANLAGVSQIEAVQLSAGGEFDFANTLSTTTVFASGTAAVDKFDGSAVTSYALQIFSNGGADTLIGGAKDDTIYVKDANFTSVDGGAGNDTLTLTASQTFDVSASASKIHNIEVINLDNTASTGVSLSIAASDIAAITPGNVLYVVVCTLDKT